MNRRRVLTVAVGLVALCACLKIAWGMFLLPTIPSHRGDGSFQDLSRRAGPFALPGYAISMLEFELAKPYQAEFHVAGLTDLGRDCGVHLAIRDHDSRWWGDTKHLDGKVEIECLDAQGRLVVGVSGRLGDYIWWGFSDLHVLYQMNSSFFRPDPAKEYRIRFAYEPDARLAGHKGFVYVRSGGSK